MAPQKPLASACAPGILGAVDLAHRCDRMTIRIVSMFGLVIVLWLLCPFVMRLFVTKPSANDADAPSHLERLGQSGDLFGAVNALFSGLAFAAVIATLWVQQREIKEGRKSANDQLQANRSVGCERTECTYKRWYLN